MITTPSGDDAFAAVTAQLLQSIRQRFYPQRTDDYRRDHPRLLYALTWPATWLEARGLTCAPNRYQTLIDARLQAIAAHGDPVAYGAYFPNYLLKCLQDWFAHHGDDLYGELKHIRNALDQLLRSPNFAAQVRHDARQLDLLVTTHRFLAQRSAGSAKASSPAAQQLTLF